MTETTTATALICTQHLSLHLYGAPWDAVTCGAAVASDVTVGVLRLVTDNHYASDILAGAGLGVLFGWGVPVLMHLRGREQEPEDHRAATLIVPVPIVLTDGGGLGAAGFF